MAGLSVRLISGGKGMLSRTGLTRAIWRDALLAWIAQRVIVLLLVICWQLLAGYMYGTTGYVYGTGAGISWHSLYHPWTTWDAGWYANIARGGYTVLSQAAFFPLFPLLEHLLAPFTTGRVIFAGLLISNVAALLAYVLLRALIEQEFCAAVARRTLFFLAFFPTSLFLTAAYTESLFLLLSLAAFALVRRHQWVPAGLSITLAILTRAAGVLLLIPLGLEALVYARSYGMNLRTRWRAYLGIAMAAALPLLALGLWQRYLDWHFGTPRAQALAVDSVQWQRHLSWPWEGIVQDLRWELASVPPILRMELTRDLFFTLAWLALAIAMLWAWKCHTMPASYVLYTWASLLLALLFPTHESIADALNSTARYLLVVFPCFVLIGQWTASSRSVYRVLRALSIVLFVSLAGFFAIGGFIA